MVDKESTVWELVAAWFRLRAQAPVPVEYVPLRPWDELTPNKRNELIALHLMGWTCKTSTVGPGGYFAEGVVLDHWYDPGGRWVPPQLRGTDADGFEDVAVPPYSTDTESVRLVEAEIERRGLRDAYVQALLHIVAPDGSSVLSFWRLLRATADQRCHAALRALGVEL